jgi:hypothetical protein
VRFPALVLPAIFHQNDPSLRQWDRDLAAAIENWTLGLKGILDRGISLADNVDAAVASYTSNATPDTEDVIAHTLGRVPSYFIVADINKGGVVYRSGTAFTKTNVYLKTTVASAAVKVILL